MDYIAKQKMRWRSRRSMLELDLFFDRFIQSGQFDTLSETQLKYYNELLQMDDGDIMLLFQGNAKLPNEGLQHIIDKIRQ
jgi:succinate dehydrogenase flavin-adding protein (antitoxin of CptAB toxin-antitoxin module)